MSREMKLSIGAIVLTMLTSVTTLVATNCGSGKNNTTTTTALETPCITACSTAANLGCKVLCSKVFGASVAKSKVNAVTPENASCVDSGCSDDSTKIGETILTMCQGKDCVEINLDSKDASQLK